MAIASDRHHLESPSIARLNDVVYVRDKRTWAAYLLLGLFAYLETASGPAMPFLRDRLDLGYAAASLHFFAFPLEPSSLA